MATKKKGLHEYINEGKDTANSANQPGTRSTKGNKAYIQELAMEPIKFNTEVCQSTFAVAMLDKNYNYIRVNEVYARGAGRNISDFPGHNLLEFDSTVESKEILDFVVRTKEIYKSSAQPYTFPDHPELGITYLKWIVVPFLDSQGEVDLLTLTSYVVTEQIRDKERLAESEERYRSIFDNSMDGIILNSSDGTILSANPAACRMFGRSEAELQAVGRNGIVDLDDPRVMAAVQEREKEGSFNSEMTMVRKDGTKFPGEVTSKLFKDSDGRILSTVIIRDISQREKAEAALRLSEQKFSKVFHNNQAAMAVTRLKDNRFVDVNRKTSELLGYSREELVGEYALDYWGDLQEKEDMMQQLSKQGYFENYETKIRKRSGEIGFALMAVNILDLEGEKYLLASLIDITEYKKAEEALRLSQEHFYKAFDTNPLFMAIVSIKDGVFREVNEVFGMKTDYGAELMKTGVTDSKMWADLSERDKFIEIIHREGRVKNFEAHMLRKSGEILTVLLSGVAINWQGEDCILTISYDITDLRRYQSEMGRLDRLNLIGEMAASIVNQVRNPMTKVKAFLQLFKSQDRYIEDREYIDLMIGEMDRAKAVITEFLSLAKNKPIELKRQNLNEKIKNLLPVLLAQAMKSDINLKLELDDIPDVTMDKDEIRQLILNLVVNGVDAMSAGGDLTIKTFKNSDGINLVIQDQGHGMITEVLERIDTPFFTTKPYGTGLGLPVCYSIANRHNARIEVETGSTGTIFKVIFPG